MAVQVSKPNKKEDMLGEMAKGGAMNMAKNAVTDGFTPDTSAAGLGGGGSEPQSQPTQLKFSENTPAARRQVKLSQAGG